MELGLIWTIALAEWREAVRYKWLWLYALGLAGLALALSQAGVAAAGYAGLGGFGRTAAGMINAFLLFVPLMGLSTGAASLAVDRERGTLTYLLSQPVSRGEVFLGKALGAALAVVMALALGFGLVGLGLSRAGSNNLLAFLELAGHTLLLALASLGLGFLISSRARKATVASSAALLTWLVLVFVGDLGLIGAALALRPTPPVLLGLLVINPLQVFKMGAIYGLRATLDTLGPVGQYAVYRFGAAVPWLLLGLLVGWIVLSFGLAFIFFRRGEG